MWTGSNLEYALWVTITLAELGASLEGTTAAAIVSFAGFVASVILYTNLPLSKSGVYGQAPTSWISLVLLGVGLVCFVVFLVTGLITFLNRGSSMPPRDGNE